MFVNVVKYCPSALIHIEAENCIFADLSEGLNARIVGETAILAGREVPDLPGDQVTHVLMDCTCCCLVDDDTATWLEFLGFRYLNLDFQMLY